MVNLRTVALSDTDFSHFQTNVDLDEVDSIDDVISYVTNQLKSILTENNLVSLSERFDRHEWHVHDYTIVDMLTDDDVDRVYYVCSHC